MKKALLIFVAAAVISSSCSTTKKTVNAATPVNKVAIENDGLSYEKAIIIQQTNERDGINAEYAWLRSKYPNYKTRSQALTYQNKKPFDILNITTADGNNLAIYFDISNFYGKF